MSQCNYSRRENGKKEITLQEWTKIAKILNVTIEEIYEPFINNNTSERLINDNRIELNSRAVLIYLENLEKENEILKMKLKKFEN